MSPLIRRIVEVRPGEGHALGWTWLYFYAVLASYYVVRPIRDEAGVAGGVDNLPWLFTGTLVAMAIANPAFGALVAKLPRVQFVSWTYRFFAVNLIGFFFALQTTSGAENIWAGRVFFVWTAVFNLFVPSVFWAFMSDVFTREQAKRLFGVIAAAGTLGAVTGSAITATLAEVFPPMYLLFASAALLELSVLSVRRLSGLSERLRAARGAASQETPIGGGVLHGMKQAMSSSYLLNVCVYMLIYTFLNTVLYFQQSDIVEATLTDRVARTAFFARVDLITQALTFLLQVFALAGMLRSWGVALTLGLLPAVSAAGFLALALVPTVAGVVWLNVARRVGNFAVARPTREVLFTVVSREDRFKAKSFIDTFVYRAGDQIAAWGYTALGLGIAGAAWLSVPISVVWLLNGMWLGRRHETLAARRAAEAASLGLMHGAEPALQPQRGS